MKIFGISASYRQEQFPLAHWLLTTLIRRNSWAERSTRKGHVTSSHKLKLDVSVLLLLIKRNPPPLEESISSCKNSFFNRFKRFFKVSGLKLESSATQRSYRDREWVTGEKTVAKFCLFVRHALVRRANQYFLSKKNALLGTCSSSTRIFFLVCDMQTLHR